MQNKITIVAGGLLGLLFLIFGLNFFFHFIPMPSPPEGSHAAAFMGAAYASGFLTFVKVLEILGAILVAIPRTRNFGLLILVPIIVNILAFHIFIAKDSIFQPPIILITALAAFLIWSGRTAIGNLLNK